MRGRSYSRSPPRRGYGRRRRSPSPRGRYRGHDRDAPTSLLVRNLRLDCRPEDLRRPFSEFGPLKDIYLPRNYYTGEPRGFGFVQFVDPADAADAKYEMDGQLFQGRELTVVFAEENRKKPVEMRARERTRSRSYDRRRSSARYSRSRSPPRRSARSRSRSPDYYSPSRKRRHHSRSVSPKERKSSRERSYSRDSRERSYSRSPSARNSRSRSCSLDRGKSRSRSPDRSQSRSRSPVSEDHSKGTNRDRSPSH
ncbi:hypothetical protein RND81_11G208000 [Saponaria officinalis]|uniref:RRM domain-containing protein n=1 Tax=Saponaria officinalis TaxID=3572 RepID=A0AAW1HPI5_SAPOF